ncbi:MAG: M14 family zinc carboxypeptidase [Weeksellaceae bacterium]|nr:M14 family zinc carboxypeptidase [Weeksellaceae bacterium]
MLLDILEQNAYQYEIIGYSFQNKPIYKMRFGIGSRRVLLWSQMHGNETTALRASLDLWNWLHSKDEYSQDIYRHFTIDFIPQLNPDGAELYTRRNAQQIDINRDFLRESSPEIMVLKDCVEKGDYDALLNMHDMRTIFHAKNSDLPASISLLAASIDAENNYNPARIASECLAGYMFHHLQDFLPKAISRFDDSHYPLATGDNFMKQGTPILLLECGHYPEDYPRHETRRFTFLTLILWLQGQMGEEYDKLQWQREYQLVPVNDNKFYDIIVYNVNIVNNTKQSFDIAIQYDEILQEDKIVLQGKIAEIGDLQHYQAHEVIDATGKHFKFLTQGELKIGSPARFKLDNEEYNFVNIQM